MGWGLLLADELDRATTVLGEGLQAAQEIGDRRAIAFARLYLGLVALYEGHVPKAEALLHESLSLANELGDQQVIAELMGEAGTAR